MLYVIQGLCTGLQLTAVLYIMGPKVERSMMLFSLSYLPFFLLRPIADRLLLLMVPVAAWRTTVAAALFGVALCSLARVIGQPESSSFEIGVANILVNCALVLYDTMVDSLMMAFREERVGAISGNTMQFTGTKIGELSVYLLQLTLAAFVDRRTLTAGLLNLGGTVVLMLGATMTRAAVVVVPGNVLIQVVQDDQQRSAVLPVPKLCLLLLFIPLGTAVVDSLLKHVMIVEGFEEKNDVIMQLLGAILAIAGYISASKHPADCSDSCVAFWKDMLKLRWALQALLVCIVFNLSAILTVTSCWDQPV